MCRNGPGESTEGALRWFAQLDAKNAEVSLTRMIGPSASGSYAFSRFTVLQPASEVVALDRLQLFQPIEEDELFGLTIADEHSASDLQLEMRFHIRTNVDIEVGCTLNSGAAIRNFTTNRAIAAGRWHAVRVALPRDQAAPWISSERFGMYFQIGLSCGETRLSKIDAQWNDGHSLMIENARSSTFLMTEGAQADITNCYFGLACSGPFQRVPTMLARTRTQRFVEKSYFSGTAPGMAGNLPGAFEIRPRNSEALGRVQFQSIKLRPYRPHLYSPATGTVGCAYDVTAARDVPAIVVEQTPQSMMIVVPDSVDGHIYRVHWLVHDFE